MAQDIDILLITPPFTQLNTPYPATAYLQGYLNKTGYQSQQCDLGIEIILKIFSKSGLTRLFNTIENGDYPLDENLNRIILLKKEYLACITPVIRFLQNKNSTLGYAIAERGYLPEAGRFHQLDDLEWAFGTLGIQDKARHLSTLFLEDISDLIKETVDPFFGFSRYAERISLSAESFDDLHYTLNHPPTFTDEFLLEAIDQKIEQTNPKLLGISIPFPGNLYSALRCGQYVKSNFPHIKISIGGGYPNTELRTVSDTRLFEFIDFITLDDGEKPIELLLDHIIKGNSELKRTLHLINKEVVQTNTSKKRDIPFAEAGTPDYKGLQTDLYLSVIELTNPMHRLWSDGRWNKLTMAHGCYWKKCTFCDISLDYIKNYDPINASIICDRIERLIEQTGETGFHFVDEAAPPALMRDVAMEIINRDLKITWWTNIRFEKRFTSDLCKLLKASGCIAVSGGLEVASDRLLAMIQKGVTVEQVAQVADNFTTSGIMVHAYLMYGFPTQTDQETIDSLEMVRQMFEIGIVQSAFWHQFAMTAHSPVGISPDQFQVESISPSNPDFAHNDLQHEDPNGADHTSYSDGLKTSLYNYMHGVGFDLALEKWFEIKTPKPTVSPYYIEIAIQNNKESDFKESALLYWIGAFPTFKTTHKRKKGQKLKRIEMNCLNNSATQSIYLDNEDLIWVEQLFLDFKANKKITLLDLQSIYTKATNHKSNKLFKSQVWKDLKNAGLLLV
ncbi:MAG: radical SAM protein [Reichenbachiella sp.]